MKVSFITPTQLSLLDITTMGDSSKRGDDSTIGCFDSGLKYAIALLLRANVDIEIRVSGTETVNDDWEQDVSDTFTFSSTIETCDATGKQKEIIVVNGLKEYHGGHASPHSNREPVGEPEEYSLKTAFALQLGHNWELWMALRELYSNMLDENGRYVIGGYEQDFGTVITLTFDEDNEFFQVWENRHTYIFEGTVLHKVSSSVDVMLNHDGYLKIYKQNILVHKDEEIPSMYVYNISFGELDERRVLLNPFAVGERIVSEIMHTKNEDYLRTVILCGGPFNDKEFLNTRTTYISASDLIFNIVHEAYEACGEVFSYNWLIASVQGREDCRIGGKKIRNISDSLYNYSSTVVVQTEPVTYSEPTVIETEEEVFEDSFAASIKSKYKFELDVEVKISKLLGSKVIADKFGKCLIIDESFDIDEDFPEFIVQYIDLTRPGNVLKEISMYLVELLKR